MWSQSVFKFLSFINIGIVQSGKSRKEQDTSFSIIVNVCVRFVIIETKSFTIIVFRIRSVKVKRFVFSVVCKKKEGLGVSFTNDRCPTFFFFVVFTQSFIIHRYNSWLFGVKGLRGSQTTFRLRRVWSLSPSPVLYQGQDQYLHCDKQE